MCDEAGGGEAVPRLQPAACLRAEAGAALSLPRVHAFTEARVRKGLGVAMCCVSLWLWLWLWPVVLPLCAMCYSHHRFPP